MDVSFLRLNQLALGYWHAQTLFTLTELAVFDLVADGGRSAPEISQSCSLDADGGEALLDAGVALGLLHKQGGLYENAELSSRLLVSGRPESLVRWTLMMGRWVEPWTKLRKALETGQPVDPESTRIGDDAHYLEEVILGVHEYASRTSADVAAAVDLGGARRLVDVGGGAGTYAIAFCERYPDLEAVVFDVEPVLPVTERTVASAGLNGRIRTATGDYRKSPLGDGVDAVLMSNVIHQESRPVGLDMLRRSFAALGPGGKAIVHGHFLDEGRTSPIFTTLQNLSARALWEGGHSYTGDEMAALLAEAEFTGIEVIRVDKSSTTLVVGRRPGPETGTDDREPLGAE